MKIKDIGKKMGYACGDIYGGGAFLIFSLLYMNFLVIVEGLTVLQATTVIFIGKIWDAVTDPAMGHLSDRTRSRFGRRRVYFLAGSVLVLASFVLLWYSFGIRDNTQLMLYHTFAYMFFGTAFTIVMVPYNAILSDMTSDYNERTGYTAMRMLFSAGAALCCAVVPAMLISRIGGAVNGPAQKQGYLVMAILFGLLFGASWIGTFFGTREKKEFQTAGSFGVREWRAVFKNKTYRAYLGIFLSVQLAIDLLLALFVFYIDIVLMRYQSYELVMGVLMVFQLLFMVAVNSIAQKKGKHFPLFIGMPVWILASICFLFFAPSTPILWICMLAGFIAFGSAAGNLSTWSMLSDSYDVDELITGKRHEGLYSGFTTFIRKFASGVAILILGVGLQSAGFNQNEYNLLKSMESGAGAFDAAAYATSSIVNAIKYLFAFVPIVLLTITLFFALRYQLNKKRFDTVQAGIARFKRDGGSAVFSEEEKTDLVAVTGKPVQALWGRGVD